MRNGSISIVLKLRKMKRSPSPPYVWAIWWFSMSYLLCRTSTNINGDKVNNKSSINRRRSVPSINLELQYAKL